MACRFSLTFFLFFTLSFVEIFNSSAAPPPATPNQVIQKACNATSTPESCKTTLTQSSNLTQNAKAIDIVLASMNVSMPKLNTAQSMVKTMLDASSDNKNLSITAYSCYQALNNSANRQSSAADALIGGRIKTARAWLSATLASQTGCWSGLKKVNDTPQVNETMAFLDSLIELTGNALSMMASYDLFGDKLDSWTPPMTGRTDFIWEVGSGTNNSTNTSSTLIQLSFPSNLTVDATVCKEGKECRYKTVQAAVDAAPDNLVAPRKFVISIKAGVYQETVRVPPWKKHVVFLGDGIGKTVITGNLSVGHGVPTHNTSTVGVSGDGFMGRGMTIENTAGSDPQQAVAFLSQSDLSIIEECEFLGNQDTLYVNSLRQYYNKCRIEGNIDFIFGNGAAVFQDCVISIRPRQTSRKPDQSESNVITAHGRTHPAQTTGFVFQNCTVNGTKEYMDLYHANPKLHKNFLGRPWKEYSRTFFINCTLGDLIDPQGWLPWDGEVGLKTLYYGESLNTGPGANRTGRVPWSSEVPKDHIYAYSLQNFIQADEWNSTSA